MRTVIEQNERFVIAKILTVKNELVEYQVCDKEVHAGHKGYVVDRTKQLGKARQVAGIEHKGSGQTTLPKSAYPEQQTGYKKQAKGVRRKGKIV